MEKYIYLLLGGIGAISLLDAAGSIISRKFNIAYSNFAIATFLIYLGIGYFGTIYIDQMAGITFAGLCALYDAIVGWKIAFALKANWGNVQEIVDEMQNADPSKGAILIGVVLGLFLGWIGSLFVA